MISLLVFLFLLGAIYSRNIIQPDKKISCSSKEDKIVIDSKRDRYGLVSGSSTIEFDIDAKDVRKISFVFEPEDVETKLIINEHSRHILPKECSRFHFEHYCKVYYKPIQYKTFPVYAKRFVTVSIAEAKKDYPGVKIRYIKCWNSDEASDESDGSGSSSKKTSKPTAKPTKKPTEKPTKKPTEIPIKHDYKPKEIETKIEPPKEIKAKEYGATKDYYEPIPIKYDEITTEEYKPIPIKYDEVTPKDYKAEPPKDYIIPGEYEAIPLTYEEYQAEPKQKPVILPEDTYWYYETKKKPTYPEPEKKEYKPEPIYPEPAPKYPEPPKKEYEPEPKYPEPVSKYPEPAPKYPAPEPKYPEPAKKEYKPAPKYPEPEPKYPEPEPKEYKPAPEPKYPEPKPEPKYPEPKPEPKYPKPEPKYPKPEPKYPEPEPKYPEPEPKEYKPAPVYPKPAPPKKSYPPKVSTSKPYYPPKSSQKPYYPPKTSKPYYPPTYGGAPIVSYEKGPTSTIDFDCHGHSGYLTVAKYGQSIVFFRPNGNNYKYQITISDSSTLKIEVGYGLPPIHCSSYAPCIVSISKSAYYSHGITRIPAIITAKTSKYSWGTNILVSNIQCSAPSKYSPV